ncbi:MAG: SGNH/GDSL hydrolase family protein [Muribaculaceae bacterium]|nr:SGNH/GDSL hydrolase family protein [Muribaculaceae bacterium]
MRMMFAALFAALISFSLPARTVAYIGGSTAQPSPALADSVAALCGGDVTWIAAGIPGTGADLAAFRLQEHVLSAKPEAVVIDFPGTDACMPAIEGMVRRIKAEAPGTGIIIPQSTEAHKRLAGHYAKGGAMPEPLYGSEWEAATMYSPAEVCSRHGLWHNLEAAKDSRLKAQASLFDKVLTTARPRSTVSFAFDGDMFGLFDVAGPEAGQLEIYVDGQMIRLRDASTPGSRLYEATPLTGSHYLKRGKASDAYELGYDLVKLEPGMHQVTIKVSDKGAPEKAYLMLGKLLVRGTIAECHPIKGLPKMEQQLKWEKKISAYMERDAEQAALTDATLVVGSSSIELWKSLETDFPGRNVIRRGVSGTKAIDLYNYRSLLIEPFNPKRIIIYEGDNEIGFKWTLDEMMAAMKKLFYEVRRMKPDAEIYLVSVKPSPVRAKRLGEIQEFNRSLKEFALSQPNTGFIDIHTPMLDADGNVRAELFKADGLHPAEEGYDIWRREFGKVINQ